MTPGWEAEQEMPAARARALVAAQFPLLRNAPVRPLATGWDNTVLLVGGVLFRFPRRAVAVELQRRELAVLPLVAGRLPLAVPEPTHLGEPAGDYPWPFWGAPMIPGDELALRPDVDRVAAAEAAGGFLRALHTLRLDVGLPLDPMNRAAPVLRAELTRRHLQSVGARTGWSAPTAVEALVASPLGPPDGDVVLVQGDLHLRHLLVDASGRATGVIDWGDTCFADPAVDLSLAYAGFDGRAREAMLAAYGPVDADREVRARALAVSLCAALADWASAAGEEQLLEEYLRGVTRAVS